MLTLSLISPVPSIFSFWEFLLINFNFFSNSILIVSLGLIVFSLIVKKGKIVTLIGPNGSGKSTTAKIALGIYKNIEGSVEKFTNKVGYVPQKISIDWTLPLRVYDFMLLTEDIKDEAIEEALTLTGVTHLKNENLGNLSGGEFQRVLIARAISKKPELWVLDEPVQGVDYTGEIALYELIKKISDTLNCGILLISH